MHRISAGIAAVALVCSGCSPQSQSVPGDADSRPLPRVYVVNYPLAYFAQRLGGDSIQVLFPVPEGVDPANWNPDADRIVEFQTADLVLLNGADYAKWTLRATLPWSRTAVTTHDVENQYLKVAEAVTHTHGPEGEHEHGGIASETWLDPQLAIAQARVIREELENLVPKTATSLTANFESLQTDLEALDRDLKAAFAALPGPWVASHPVYDYLDRRYALNLQCMHWEPDQTPTDEQWQAFEDMLKSTPSPFMLWEGEPTPETAQRLQQLGVTTVVFRIGDRRPASGDYLELMQDNVKRLRDAAAGRP